MTPEQFALCYGSLIQYLLETHFQWMARPRQGLRPTVPRTPPHRKLVSIRHTPG